MRTITAETERKKYPIHIGSGISAQTGALAAEITGSTKAALITDDNVDRLYSVHITKSLEMAGFKVLKHVIPHGESSKSMGNYIKILGFLAENKLSRSDTLFALGGGMVGDISGFAAATYLRGIRFVQIPTTLLAAVDSSAGGKTAVNLDSGKNQVGTFYQPDLVVCDPDLLSSLPDEIFNDGCAEVIKYGIIADRRLFGMLKEPIRPRMEEIIERCLTIKCRLVYEDEFDSGPRQLLNFGHTFGHAVEKCSNYSISHGKAVSIGMVMAAAAAEEMGICEVDCSREIKEMVKTYGLPYTTELSEEMLLDVMLSDKKRSGEEMTFIFPEEIGRCLVKKYPLTELKNILRSALKGCVIE